MLVNIKIAIVYILNVLVQEIYRPTYCGGKGTLGTCLISSLWFRHTVAAMLRTGLRQIKTLNFFRFFLSRDYNK